MVNNFLFLCVCVLLVTWRANGIVLYMYEGKVLMDMFGLRRIHGYTTHLSVSQHKTVKA